MADLNEIAAGGPRALERITTAVNAARRTAWAGIAARYGGLPGVRIADKVLDRVSCIRLDATVAEFNAALADYGNVVVRRPMRRSFAA